ncbi:MAG: chromosome segregation protein SMC, partial [Nocardioidaceae bacterium]
GKMEDVIFAGTSSRPPLGRAEVLLTIDNTDGALDIDYTEVTISRTMFRNGGSEYAINGQTCRLLDVQELLSDSGIGREMHVIVGQGQLDAILHASPEERRGFVEEAAGVLKHRKRKDKALRKLDATEGNLTRLGDLLSEIRRQLKPLGRQAEVAKRASLVQMEVRDARARLLADDVVSMRASLEQELADEEAIRQRRAGVEAGLTGARRTEAELEKELRNDAPRLARAQQTWFALSGLRERLRSTAGLAAERVRNVADEPAESPAGRDPEELEAEAARVREHEEEIQHEVVAHRGRLEETTAARQAAEASHAEEDRRVAGLVRAAADRREGLARLTGEVNSIRSRAAAADDEIARLAAARDEASTRARRAQKDFTALETSIAGLDAGERGLDAEYEGAVSTLDDADERLAKLRDELQGAERERTALAARKEALEIGLSRKDGAGALLATSDTVSGLLGSVAALLSIHHGYEAAVAAALGPAADAVAVDGVGSAVGAIEMLKREDLGRAGLLLAGGQVDDAAWPGLPADATYVVDVLEAPGEVLGALRRLLYKTAVVDSLAEAQRLVAELPDLVAVTRDGDVLGRHFASGGSSTRLSLLEVQAALDETEAGITEIMANADRLRFEQSRAQSERDDAQRRVDVALARLHESDAAMAAVAEELGQLGSLARAAASEAARVDAAIAEAQAAHARDIDGLTELEQRLASATESADVEPDTGEVEQLGEQARLVRQAEMDTRLALRTSEERARALRGRAESLLAMAEQERAARAHAVARRERRSREARTADAVGTGARVVLARLEHSLSSAVTQRTEIESSREGREHALSETRGQVRRLESELATLVDTVHRDEMLRAEHRMRMEQLEQRALVELGLDLEALVTGFGPDQLVPPIPAPPGDETEIEPHPTAYDREQQSKRLRVAERALAQLGKINPLALEEFSALEERHKYLTGQLEDLRKTRRDLLDIVREVDERVEQVFSQAYADVEREFEGMFARLFPGGEGRLVLTAPDDLLATGIEVEARPPGKKVKRLSLLSGGERALVAVAFLVSLFKARPSPFYILDEVEAALDDVNLDRLLQIYEELRESSQLLVITHQKRTMEGADALYGISMRGDGVSSVISQRLREAESA